MPPYVCAPHRSRRARREGAFELERTAESEFQFARTCAVGPRGMDAPADRANKAQNPRNGAGPRVIQVGGAQSRRGLENVFSGSNCGNPASGEGQRPAMSVA